MIKQRNTYCKMLIVALAIGVLLNGFYVLLCIFSLEIESENCFGGLKQVKISGTIKIQA